MKDRSLKHIHVIGSGPRTGTTLLAEVLNACTNVDEFCEHEAPVSAVHPGLDKIYLTKDPGDIASVKLPLMLNRDLYVVCIMRDPRDAIVSRHGGDREKYWTGLRYWKRFVKKLPSVKGHQRFILIRYEDFVHNPDAVQERLIAAIPFLRATGPFSRFHELAKPSKASLSAMRDVRPIEPVGIGSWRKHPGRVRQQIDIHGDISDELIMMGYEKDHAWLSLIKDVSPISDDSSRPERILLSDKVRSLERSIHAACNILLYKLGAGATVICRLNRLYHSFRVGIKKVVR